MHELPHRHPEPRCTTRELWKGKVRGRFLVDFVSEESSRLYSRKRSKYIHCYTLTPYMTCAYSTQTTFLCLSTKYMSSLPPWLLCCEYSSANPGNPKLILLLKPTVRLSNRRSDFLLRFMQVGLICSSFSHYWLLSQSSRDAFLAHFAVLS